MRGRGGRIPPVNLRVRGAENVPNRMRGSSRGVVVGRGVRVREEDAAAPVAWSPEERRDERTAAAADGRFRSGAVTWWRTVGGVLRRF